MKKNKFKVSIVLSIVDMSSIKVKVSVDELNIGKVKTGQKATVKFDAIKDKTFEGTVETIAEIGTTANNVTTYNVVEAVKDPAGIKLGMNANITISVESKDNVIAVPDEAVMSNNNQKFVRMATTDTSTSGSNSQASSDKQTQANSQVQNGNGTNNKQASTSGTNSKVVAIKTGLETENYIEITEGLQEGDKVLVTLPQTSSTSNNKNNFGGLGDLGGDMGAQKPKAGQGGKPAPAAPKK
jgi:HlyD family secretion protein